MTEITEGNRLIAEFMGFEFKEQEWRKPYPTTATKIKDRWYPMHMLEYHTSWDWLRPVIDEIFKYSLAHPEEAGKVCKMSIVVNIDAAWEKVIQFIKWYNQNK